MDTNTKSNSYSLEELNRRRVREVLESGICRDCISRSLHACVLLAEQELRPLVEEGVYGYLAEAGTHMVVSVSWVEEVYANVRRLEAENAELREMVIEERGW